MDAQNYIPPTSDTALGLLHRIFGAPIEHITPGLPGLDPSSAATTSTLGAMFGWFNGGILFFGAIILMWVTVMGLTNTANDGVVLGKKWSTFFTPLRTLTASALLIPSTTGYSGIQILILKIVLWGCGFASIGWGVYVEHAVVEDATSTVMQSVVDDSSFDALAAAAIRMQVCAHSTNKAIVAVFPYPVQPLGISFKEAPKVQVSETVQNLTTIGYKSPNWTGSDEICGKMQIGSSFYSSPHTNDQGTANIAAQLADQITMTRYKFVIGLFGPDGVQRISDQIITAVEGQGQTVDPVVIRSQITQLRQTMLAELRNTVRAGITAGNVALLAKLTDKGWVSAGSLYMEVSRLKDTVRGASKVNSNFEPGAGFEHLIGPGSVATAMREVTLPYASVTGLALTRALSTPQSQVKPPLPSLPTFQATDFMDGGTSVKAFFSRTFKSWSEDIVHLVVFSLNPNDNKDMIWQIKDLGDNIAGYSEAALVASAAMKGGLEGLLEASKTGAQESVMGTNISLAGAVVVGAIAGVKGMFVSLMAMLSQGLYALLYLGYFLGIWIPMIPFFIFTIGVVGWLIVVVESLIAGSLWTVFHLTPEGNDSFIGGQQQGYLILMSVFFRPALMTFGLICSVVLLNPVVGYVNESFMTMFRVLQADSMTGLLSVAGYILAYGVVIFSTVMLVFSLPQTLPDRILRWVGAGIGDLGEHSTAQRIEQAGSGQARAAMVAGSGALRSSAGNGKDAVRRALGPARDQADSSAAGRAHSPEGHTLSSLTIGPGSSGVE